MVKAGNALCRTLLFRLRYQGSENISTADKIKDAVAAALFSQRVFDTIQDTTPVQLTEQLAQTLHKEISKFLQFSVESALYFLEFSVIACELYEKPFFRRFVWKPR